METFAGENEMSGQEKIDRITINDVEYVRADRVIADDEIKIVVLDRGFIYVGATTVDIDNEFITIRNAHNIRVWGTTRGLGELTAGPTSSTKIDRVGTVKAPLRALISVIDTEAGAWKSIC